MLQSCESCGLQIKIGNDKDAGKILAYQVSRRDLRYDSRPFHHFFDIPSENDYNVANAVFDRLGHLKRHLYGNFKAETDQGDFLYVRSIKVKPQFRKKGLACIALKLLLRKLSQRQADNMPGTEWWFAGRPLQSLAFHIQESCILVHW